MKAPVTTCILLLISGALASNFNSFDSALREKTIPQAWRELVEGHEAELKAIIQSSIPKTMKTHGFSDILFPTEDDPVRNPCDTCQNLLQTLLDVIDEYGYPIFERLVIRLCIEGANRLGMRGDVLCPGSIEHQGPHLLKAVADGGTRRFCEHINICYPDDTLLGLHPIGSKDTVKTADRTNSISKVPRSRRNVDLEDAIKVVQLADIHVEPDYAVGSPTDCGLSVCCLDKWSGSPPNDGFARPFGDFNCNVPQKTINSFLDKIRETVGPDFAIYTGDSPPHTMWEEDEASQMLCTELVAGSLDANLSCPVYASIGNHEMYPTNLYSHVLEPTSTMTNRFAELWAPLSGFGEEQIETMKKGGYYSILQREGLRILNFNSNYMYTFNWYNTLNWLESEPEEMMTFIEEELSKARENGEKVILVGHHVPGNSDFLISSSRRFAEIWKEYNDIIVLHIAGHTHQDEFKLVLDPETGEAEHVVIVCPSMDARNVRNPGARVYYLDPETFLPLDYDHYFLDLNEDSGDVTLMYRASEEYGLNDLTATSYKDFTDRMEDDIELLNVHFNNGDSRAREKEECDEACARTLLCRRRTASFDDLEACLSSAPLTEASPLPDPDATEDSAGTTQISLLTIAITLILQLVFFN